ncbi:MAG: hypothetical protein IPK21_16735 [Haliscomenobacter sp.]|nr:hypothetical protein [Haliscomenobacter sp.]
MVGYPIRKRILQGGVFHNEGRIPSSGRAGPVRSVRLRGALQERRRGNDQVIERFRRRGGGLRRLKGRNWPDIFFLRQHQRTGGRPSGSGKKRRPIGYPGLPAHGAIGGIQQERLGRSAPWESKRCGAGREREGKRQTFRLGAGAQRFGIGSANPGDSG